ncbi:hypothetical protein [Flavivirga jejuensis]|uniref:PKD/Chitinase domain-containing protein n=1 Tax=Flavivirga jejuensis TaxID=870487 RepID=A0ABT8WML5_9FLAO|nr:hypothetical protein [Flavivirga jejuensis]MDO5974363.1 hypothetical protein [Flavivirga jejuensis]
MKKLNFFYCLLAVSLLAGCGSDDTETTSNEGIIADFSFSNDESEFTFTNLSEGATSYRWDFGDLYFYSEEENPVYNYDIVGGELTVTLTAIGESGAEAYVSKTIIAPIVINANIDIDGGFEDWDVVPVSNEFPSGVIKKMKYYTKGANIDIYLEGDPDMTLDIVDMLFNIDEDNGTGYNEAWNIGADYLFEGSLAPGEGSFYTHTGTGGGFTWNWIGLDPTFETSGVIIIDDETNALEMRLPKSLLGATGETINFGMWLNWGTEFYPEDRDGSSIEIKLK